MLPLLFIIIFVNPSKYSDRCKTKYSAGTSSEIVVNPSISENKAVIVWFEPPIVILPSFSNNLSARSLGIYLLNIPIL